MRKLIAKQSKDTLKKVVALLKAGGVVIFPTDTVYGFLADASNRKAVEKIYQIKNRSKTKPLPFFVKNISMAKKFSKISKNQERVVKKHWPGKFTFVLQKKSGNKLYGAEKNTVAFRMPRHSFLLKLLSKMNKPLAQTSVNISGKKSLTKVPDIVKSFGKERRVDLIINGGTIKKARPSKVVDLTKNKEKVLRK